MTKQRKWTRKIFRFLEKNGFHPKDIEYGDGYFIFEHGKDKVIHFHVKELKGWKFGIWWDIDGDESYDFFGQFEANIDKFKPTASAFVEENLDTDDFDLKWKVLKILRFIKKHPYLAWGADLNIYKQEIWDLVDIEHPMIRYYQERLQYWWADKVYKRFNKQYLKLVTKAVNEKLISPEIIDENIDGWKDSPRYFIRCKGIKGEKYSPGHYGLEFAELSPKLQKELARYEARRSKKINQPWRTKDISLNNRLLFSVRKENK